MVRLTVMQVRQGEDQLLAHDLGALLVLYHGGWQIISEVMRPRVEILVEEVAACVGEWTEFSKQPPATTQAPSDA